MPFLENIENLMFRDGSDEVNDSLAFKLFKDQCCESCSCKSEHEKTSPDITTS